MDGSHDKYSYLVLETQTQNQAICNLWDRLWTRARTNCTIGWMVSRNTEKRITDTSFSQTSFCSLVSEIGEEMRYAAGLERARHETDEGYGDHHKSQPCYPEIVIYIWIYIRKGRSAVEFVREATEAIGLNWNHTCAQEGSGPSIHSSNTAAMGVSKTSLCPTPALTVWPQAWRGAKHFSRWHSLPRAEGRHRPSPPLQSLWLVRPPVAHYKKDW